MSRDLDMNLLRTLAASQAYGGFTRAADRVGRSQSAVSQQMRKLEAQAGCTLFRKQGRAVVLTEEGQTLLAYAQRILDLNDEAVAALRGAQVDGAVRLGLPADLAETWLPDALGRFARSHPAVRVDASVERNGALLERLDRGELDLVLAFGGEARGDAETLARLPVRWIGPARGSDRLCAAEPLPLAMFGGACLFRRMATEALDERGVGWRVAFTGSSVHALWAAVGAGLGLTARPALAPPPSVAVIEERAGLPRLGTVALCAHDGGRPLGPAAARLKAELAGALADGLARAA